MHIDDIVSKLRRYVHTYVEHVSGFNSHPYRREFFVIDPDTGVHYHVRVTEQTGDHHRWRNIP